MSMMNIPLDMIEPNPNNPRKDFSQEGLSELAASIRSFGVLQPVVVVQPEYPAEGNAKMFRLVAGERRWRAAKEAGLVAIPAVIKYGLSEAQELEIMVVENLQRKDVNPIEEASGFKLLLDAGLRQEELAERLGKSQSHIANRLRLLELPESVRENISRGIIGPGHAKELLTAKKLMFGQEIMERVAESVVVKGLPVREIAKEIAAQSEEVTAERAAEAERKRLQEEELACQEEERQRLRAEREAEREGLKSSQEIAAAMDTVTAEQARRLALVAAGVQKQETPKCEVCEYKKFAMYREQIGVGCVWNDVMLLDDVEQEPLNNEQREMLIAIAEYLTDEQLASHISTETNKEYLQILLDEAKKRRDLLAADLQASRQEDWGESRPLPDHPDCKECNIGQAYLIDPEDGETQTLRCTEAECWELKMQEIQEIQEQSEPVYTMSNTFLYTAKCPENCEHIVTVVDQGQPFKMCKNGECEFNKPEAVIMEGDPADIIQNTMNTHPNCPDGCKYKISVKHMNMTRDRCSNPEFNDNCYTQDGEWNQDSFEAWKACRGIFKETTVKSNVLPVKENPEFNHKSTHNTHDNCPDSCMFKALAGTNGFLRDRCLNADFSIKATNWNGFEENSKLFQACRGFSAPEVKEEPQPEPAGGLISADAEQISPLEKTCQYVDNDGRILFVTYGAAGKAYRTFYQKAGEDTLTCMKSTSMPYVDTREEAEKNLVEYAEKRGWKMVGQEQIPVEQSETKENGIYLPDVEGIDPMSTILMSKVDKLLQFPLDSKDYSIVLGMASENELDAALFRDCRENGKFRIQAEKDRRLLEQVNSQLTGMGENIVQEG